MTKTEIYLVRHGKTMFNTMQRVQGWCDTPLTTVGVDRIEALGRGLKDIRFVELGIFLVALFLLRKFKTNAITIILGSGVVGTLIYMLLGMV